MTGCGNFSESLDAQQHPKAWMNKCNVWDPGINYLSACCSCLCPHHTLSAPGCRPHDCQLPAVMTFFDCAGFTEPLTDEQQHQVGLLSWHVFAPQNSSLRNFHAYI